MRAAFPPNYECDLVRVPGSKDLIVCLSHKEEYAFFKQKFGINTLYVRDLRETYFAQYPGMMSNWLGELFETEHFNRVLFFGMSKAGFGALLWSGVCAKVMPHRYFSAVAFSPQTKIYPPNKRLYFPSYLKLLRRADGNARLRENLEKYGDLRAFSRVTNVHWKIIYCDGNALDVDEAMYVRGARVRNYPLPFSFHGSTIPFSLHGRSIEDVRKEVASIYKSAAKEEDLKFTLPADSEDLVRSIVDASWIPSLKDVLVETLEAPMRRASV